MYSVPCSSQTVYHLLMVQDVYKQCSYLSVADVFDVCPGLRSKLRLACLMRKEGDNVVINSLFSANVLTNYHYNSFM